ncbi:protein argonaute 14-like [Temnothorax curvispinosus]|uniref:Protein argonaute 14-like n=1 Tax=Temnothorax curvispinosus TaxID=300111 RepID=A0A6J1QVZ3_9HYME|nr:protein argonaute 14-like [Temnothorax curvispinosus]
MHYEIEAIKRAVSEVTGDKNNIEINCLVVQKRHQVCLHSGSTDMGDIRYSNTPGTIVDTTITNPEYTEFYLLSHASTDSKERSKAFSPRRNVSHNR